MINWFRRKDNSDKVEIVTNDVPLSTIYRWYLYDTELSPDINKLAEMVGLTPVSEEGDTLERKESEARIDNMSPLFPYLESIADFSAALITSIHVEEALKSLGEDGQEEILQHAEDMENIYKAIALSTLVGAVSIGLSLGIIEHRTINSGTLNVDMSGEEND